MTEPIRLMVVDDHPVVLRGVELLVEDAPDVVLVGRASTSAEALAVAEVTRPDVVLLDLRLPDALGTETARQIHGVQPEVQVAIFTAHVDHPVLAEPRPPNVRGFLLKEIDGVDLVTHIRACAAGTDIEDRRLGRGRTSGSKATVKITERERDVLAAVAAGSTNREIAESLGLAENTVKAYLRSILQKFGSRNRLEAVMFAQRQGLI